jgi:hypothetical protein
MSFVYKEEEIIMGRTKLTVLTASLLSGLKSVSQEELVNLLSEGVSEAKELAHQYFTKGQLYMCDFIDNIEHVYNQVYIIKVRTTGFVIDAIADKIYRFDMQNTQIKQGGNKIFVKHVDSKNWECIYTTVEGLTNKYLVNVSATIYFTTGGGNEYLEINVNDKSGYGSFKLKIHHIIAALKYGYKVLNCMGKHSTHDIHHTKGKYCNRIDCLVFMTHQEHIELHNVLRRLKKQLVNYAFEAIKMIADAYDVQVA